MEMKIKLFAFAFLGFLLVISFQVATSAAPGEATPPTPPKIDCDGKCKYRCEKVQAQQDRCLKYCNLCCGECNCVPSGHFGNKDECPCYRDKLSRKGKSKCP